jgi:hypothetical protein
MPPPVAPGPPPDGSDDAPRSRLALGLAAVAEVVLLVWLAAMAWSDLVDDPPLSVDDGVAGILTIGGVATALILTGLLAHLHGRRPAGSVAGVVLGLLAGIVGFFGGLLLALGRIEDSEH